MTHGLHREQLESGKMVRNTQEGSRKLPCTRWLSRERRRQPKPDARLPFTSLLLCVQAWLEICCYQLSSVGAQRLLALLCKTGSKTGHSCMHLLCMHPLSPQCCQHSGYKNRQATARPHIASYLASLVLSRCLDGRPWCMVHGALQGQSP